ncbi:hypothetical protein HPP92_002187 [Vanilla planifolia]|uniref:Uncharacterized protein n=1 Tax=Vanilla planifolia TaxID=51239 RepID=A0A835S0R3_VANPL|nr:hypothetical protein HPP92_002187 [Vanilla planifolia]
MVEGNSKEAMDGIDGVFRTASPVFLVGDVQDTLLDPIKGIMTEEEPPCDWSAFDSLDLPMEFPEQETLLTNLLDHWEEEEEAIQQPTVPMATTSATKSSHLEVTEMTCDLLLINDPSLRLSNSSTSFTKKGANDNDGRWKNTGYF